MNMLEEHNTNEDRYICDVCGEDMHAHWFLIMDSNGHIVGQTTKENGADKVVTMTAYRTAPWRDEDTQWNAIITLPRFRDAFIEMTMATGLCSQAAATRYCCWLEGLFWWQQ